MQQSDVDEDTPINEDSQSLEPPLKQFSLLSGLIQERTLSESRNEDVDELSNYMSLKSPIRQDGFDPYDFWNKNCSQYPKLAPIAQDLLVVPASSTPIERVFSAAGYASSGRRNRLGGNTLETEVFIKTNKKYTRYIQ